MRLSERQAQTRRLFLPLVVLILVASGGALNPAWAGPLTTRATAGFNPAVIDDTGGSASASDSVSYLYFPGDGSSAHSHAYASPAGLSVFATSTGFNLAHPVYGAGANFTVVSDTTFNYQPDYLGGQDDWVEVGLTGALSGSIVGERQGGTGSARARIDISGNIWTAPPDEGGVFINRVSADTGDRGGSVRSFDDSQVININEFVSTGYFWVPRGDAVTFTVGLSVQIYSDRNSYGSEPSHHGKVTADFADTFAFDPYNFFDILTPGVTANSPSLGLVDNQLVAFIDTDPTTVPIPAALPLMASGLVVLGVFVRRRSGPARLVVRRS